MTTHLKSDALPLVVDCVYSNIGEEFTAEARDEDTNIVIAVGRGRTRPEALRELADNLEVEL